MINVLVNRKSVTFSSGYWKIITFTSHTNKEYEGLCEYTPKNSMDRPKDNLEILYLCNYIPRQEITTDVTKVFCIMKIKVGPTKQLLHIKLQIGLIFPKFSL